VSALITAWLEVRVLPGPPRNKINDLYDILATMATAIGDSTARPYRPCEFLHAVEPGCEIGD
jgi:hypothetical protein